MNVAMLLALFWLLAPPPEERAIAYLAGEVPRWHTENRCFSCHNNGDGARALFAARAHAYRVPEEALANTTRWLRRPADWDNNPGDPQSSDKKLARIQFGAALTEAFLAGVATDKGVLVQAAESLLSHQEKDGSWQVDSGSAVGSPATYGAALATFLARRTLEAADAGRFRDAASRADRWLAGLRNNTIPDAAAVAMALRGREAQKAREALDTIRRGEASGGGWGPYVKAPPEPFDTALALLALAPDRDQADVAKMIERGRAYLIQAQLPSGGWPETTRPRGGHSYAQHISTSGWATLALVKTRDR